MTTSTYSYTYSAPTNSALTTTFTPPPSCTDSFANDGLRTDGLGSYRPVLQATYPQSSACFASGWSSAPNEYAIVGNFWSGAPMCPSGQTVAQTYTFTTVTTAICCSSGWGDVFSNIDTHSGTVYPFWMCQSSWTTPATTTVYGTVISARIWSTTASALTAPGGMESKAEYMFIYDQADLTTSSSQSNSVATPSTSPTPSPVPSHNGLSGGAIAGICIGIIALIVALCALIIWRRKKTAVKETDEPGLGKAELSGEPKKLVELPGGSGHDDGKVQDSPAELHVEPAELEASNNAARDQ